MTRFTAKSKTMFWFPWNVPTKNLFVAIQIIYRDVELNGVRFETEMEPKDFTDMIYSPDSVFLVFKNKNGEFLGKVESKKLQESFDKLRSVVNKN